MLRFRKPADFRPNDSGSGLPKPLGTEPLSKNFELEAFQQKIKRSRQPIHIRLLAQNIVAGLGNIYTGEALFEAGIHPQTPSSQLMLRQVRQLRHCIQITLSQAIERGNSLPLNLTGAQKDSNSLFYFGRKGRAKPAEEPWRVYGREGKNCVRCAGKNSANHSNRAKRLFLSELPATLKNLQNNLDADPDPD